ncbi:MAG TPA: 50S ribosomal protein L3 [Verrucomicrobiales bacterium]|nr:50S ribosomal protein L3 [Verrucomicrobiales bacterium]HIL69736.1 50S ribosomal protein L3 [Verrucomicrobiota bacterium]
MVGLIGKKIGQTRVYDENGKCHSVTVVAAGPNYVIQCKTQESDGYEAVQLGFDSQKDHRLNKPLKGHLKKFRTPSLRRIREFRDFTLDVKPGDKLGVDIFSKGDYIDAIGTTKGKGFQGVVRRYNFGGGPASHGHGGFTRRTGGIGQGTDPGHVKKGQKMPGHMGQVRRTVQNLKIIQVREKENLLLIQGAVPGANGDYLIIREAKKRPKSDK